MILNDYKVNFIKYLISDIMIYLYFLVLSCFLPLFLDI